MTRDDYPTHMLCMSLILHYLMYVFKAFYLTANYDKTDLKEAVH